MSQTSVHRVRKREDPTIANLNHDSTKRILRNVDYQKAFFFYEDIDKPTKEFAVSLSDFCDKIDKISSQSLAFHLKRGDFENWIRETIGDSELSQQVGKLKTKKTMSKKDARIRTKLHTTVRNHIAELQDLWHNNSKWQEPLPNRP
jgi:hypothetical protein